MTITFKPGDGSREEAEFAVANRFAYIAAWLVRNTRNAAGRAFCRGYQVKRVAGGFQVLQNGGDLGYTTMTDSGLFDWARRTDLSYYINEADQRRIDLAIYHGMA